MILRRSLLMECVSLAPRDFGRLDVTVVDRFGTEMKGARIEVVGVGRDLSRVPYGRVTVKVTLMGFSTGFREVTIDRARTALRVVLDVGVECGPSRYTLQGRIRGGGADLWVKAVPVLGPGGEETRVLRDGTFSIAGLATGSYVVLVLRGEAVVHQGLARLVRGAPDLEFTLG